MKNLTALALVAALASPAFAQGVPLNTVTGGAGDAQVDGQALLSGGLLTSGVGLVAAIAVAALATSQATNSTDED